MINDKKAETKTPLFDTHFVDSLPADPVLKNSPRQVKDACFSFCEPVTPSEPQLVAYAEECAQLLGLDENSINSLNSWNSVLSGAQIAQGSKPYAMRYAGHQFGHWAGQLGDGRAINLGEYRHDEQLHNIQLKGAGPTPYSRAGDGFAVLRSSIREFVCSEAMFHLNVPTTRALSLFTSGDPIVRDMFYDGNAQAEPGAVVCRVAPSFLRFGNFQIHAAYGELDSLKQLADYTIQQFFPHLLTAETGDSMNKETYLAWFDEVQRSTAEMIVHWQRIGFVHGVMNTDNMSIHGLTIDYGPYGFLDNFDSDWTPNTTDAQQGRYRFGNQASIAHWNLIQLAQALHPLIDDIEALQEVANRFPNYYRDGWQAMMAQKLGLDTLLADDPQLFIDLVELLEATETDMTLFYRQLADFNGNLTTVNDLLSDVYYFSEESPTLSDHYITQRQSWFERYQQRLTANTSDHAQRKSFMNSVNPIYIPRNYLVQVAIEEAEKGHFEELHQLIAAFKNPYEAKTEFAKYAEKRPDWAREKAGCSMLSCSS